MGQQAPLLHTRFGGQQVVSIQVSVEKVQHCPPQQTPEQQSVPVVHVPKHFLAASQQTPMQQLLEQQLPLSLQEPPLA